MESAHQRLSSACVLVSRAAGTLEVACAEYEAAHLTLKRWWVVYSSSPSSQVRVVDVFPPRPISNDRQLTDSAPAAERAEESKNPSASGGGTGIDDVLEQVRSSGLSVCVARAKRAKRRDGEAEGCFVHFYNFDPFPQILPLHLLAGEKYPEPEPARNF